MSSTINAVIGPLIKRRIFSSEEEAVRELLKSYIIKQISNMQRTITRLERKYGMKYERFVEYLHERSLLLNSKDLSDEQRLTLGQSIMQEEDDCLDWKAAGEMLENWLGLRSEIIV